MANPSRLDDGCTSLSANVKSDEVMQRGASWASVSGSGCALRKWAIELEDNCEMMWEKGVVLVETERDWCWGWRSEGGGSTIMEASC